MALAPPATTWSLRHPVAGWRRRDGRGLSRRATPGSIASSRSRCCPPSVSRRPERRQRFEREARADLRAAATRTSARCYDVGDHDGVDFLVMEYLEGETLADRLTQGTAAGSTSSLRYAVQIADALDHAHRAGHRAPRPEAEQRHADAGGREAARLRAGARIAPLSVCRRCSPDGRPTRRAPDRRRHDRRHVPVHGARAGGGQARPTPGPTSSRSGPCSTRWLTGRRAFAGRATPA